MLRFAAAVVAASAALGVGAGWTGPASADTMKKVTIVDESSIPESLTGTPGDPVEGRKVAINRKLGNCLACHSMPIPEQAFHGEVGPTLAGVASRLEEGEIRLQVVNPKVVNPATIMPAFYRTQGLNVVLKSFKDKPILTAQQVEDVVAYLMTLKEE